MKTACEGGCLCGGVRYRHAGPLREGIGCHCNQCRRTSGHFVAATRGTREGLILVADAGLRWYESSPGCSRGFCGQCGSSLFRARENSERISIMAGTLDRPTGLGLTRHIHVADRGDYYRIDPDLPCAEQGDVLPDIPATNKQEES